MERRNIAVGEQYLCHEPRFSWSFIGQAVSIEEEKVQIQVVKCHPDDRGSIHSNHPILSLAYPEIIETI